MISGQKMWISNAGFADIFIVFARIEDDKNITAFIVPNDPKNGIELGDEEKKLGIHSSSTRQVFFTDFSSFVSKHYIVPLGVCYFFVGLLVGVSFIGGQWKSTHTVFIIEIVDFNLIA